MIVVCNWVGRTVICSSITYVGTNMEQVRKPFIVNVFLNQRIYGPGDTVDGEIELDLRKRMLCDLITAQIYGSAKVFFIGSPVNFKAVTDK